MKLIALSWGEFWRFLVFKGGRKGKYKDSEGNRNSVRYRFSSLQKWFVDHDLDFTEDNFMLFLEDMRKKGSADSSLNKWITTGKNIDLYLKANQLTRFSFFEVEQNIDIEIITFDEGLKLSDVSIPYQKRAEELNQRNRLLYQTFVLNGERANEIFNAKWTDLHELPMYFTITLKDTKTRTQRHIVISRKMGEEIMSFPRKSEYIFSTYRGGRLRVQEVNNDLARRTKAINLNKNVTTKTFRHSVITQYLQLGLEISDVANIVGHRDPRTTMRYKHAQSDHFFQAQQLNPILAREADFSAQVQRIELGLPSLMFPQFPFQVDKSEDEIVIRIKRNALINTDQEGG